MVTDGTPMIIIIRLCVKCFLMVVSLLFISVKITILSHNLLNLSNHLILEGARQKLFRYEYQFSQLFQQ